jgi:ubiquinone/menaquinone biosynthesis C-methylase UbiE
MNSETIQRRAFERRAAGYDRAFLRDRWPRNQEWKADAVAAALPVLAPEDLLLEVGCGTGQIAELVLQRLPCRYLGVDLAPAMLAVARDRLAQYGDRIELREATASSLPLGDGAASAAFGVDVLHHVDGVDGALGELHRVLRPGATAFFLEGNPFFPLNALIALRSEERGLLQSRPKNYERWFRAAGFDVGVQPAGLFTPPGPSRVAPLLDATDRLFARVPGVRALGIFHAITAVRGMFNNEVTGLRSNAAVSSRQKRDGG